MNSLGDWEAVLHDTWNTFRVEKKGTCQRLCAAAGRGRGGDGLKCAQCKWGYHHVNTYVQLLVGKRGGGLKCVPR